jgi:preprotein translocase subunit YajC
MFISSAWAQQAGGFQLPAGMEGIAQFVPLILIFAVFYFLLIRPQQKKMKAHRELMTQLARGDRVVTNGGLVGTITKVVSDSEVQVEIADGVRVIIMRPMIASVINKTETKAEASSS